MHPLQPAGLPSLLGRGRALLEPFKLSAFRLESAQCGLLQVVTEGRRPGTVRSFLDSTQYSTTSILRYERIFGSGFVSTGGLETTQVRRPGRLSAQLDANKPKRYV